MQRRDLTSVSNPRNLRLPARFQARVSRGSTPRRGWRWQSRLLIALLGGLALIGLLPVAQPSTAQTEPPTPTPLPIFALPDARLNRAYSSNTIALAGDGRTLVAANMINNSMTILIPQFDRVIAEVEVGNDPRSVAITPDGTRALVANHGDGTLSVVDINTARSRRHDWLGRCDALRRRH